MNEAPYAKYIKVEVTTVATYYMLASDLDEAKTAGEYAVSCAMEPHDIRTDAVAVEIPEDEALDFNLYSAWELQR